MAAPDFHSTIEENLRRLRKNLQPPPVTPAAPPRPDPNPRFDSVETPLAPADPGDAEDVLLRGRASTPASSPLPASPPAPRLEPGPVSGLTDRLSSLESVLRSDSDVGRLPPLEIRKILNEVDRLAQGLQSRLQEHQASLTSEVQNIRAHLQSLETKWNEARREMAASREEMERNRDLYSRMLQEATASLEPRLAALEASHAASLRAIQERVDSLGSTLSRQEAVEARPEPPAPSPEVQEAPPAAPPWPDPNPRFDSVETPPAPPTLERHPAGVALANHGDPGDAEDVHLRGRASPPRPGAKEELLRLLQALEQGRRDGVLSPEEYEASVKVVQEQLSSL